MYIKIHKNLILTALLTIVIMAAISNQIFQKTSAAIPPQQQQQQQQQEQLKIPNNSSNATTTATTISTNIRPNIQTDFNPNVLSPNISKTAFLDPFAVVIGDCEIGKLVLVASFAVCRGDEGTPIHIGDYSNLQEGVILHSLETTSHGKNIDDRRYSGQGFSFEG